MKSVRILSKLLSFLSRVLAVGYLLSMLLVALSLTTGWSLRVTDEGRRFEVLYPFTDQGFLLGMNTGGFIFEMLFLLGLYGLFFWLLGNVFRAFTHTKLFTDSSVRHLRRFYMSNWVVPGLAVFVLALVSGYDEVAPGFVILHGLLGVFTFFLAAIFQQGLNLQKEQDLII